MSEAPLELTFLPLRRVGASRLCHWRDVFKLIPPPTIVVQIKEPSAIAAVNVRAQDP